ncbi:glycosyltransferase family 4 protein [Bacillus sp. H-16]|uniref:glycosyltransferase family 4 protein n=1 Tax=Alteribacter salitolerans TaxID=2912333 RepID=UPI001964CC26|nr:glycosyltransferase family 4 protein [Alteribacter salitolerans]MBM7094986.1 glycosyltransferase family 4 protein [Alteribacter salitolerans]
MKKKTVLHMWVLTAEYEPYLLGGLGTAATQLTHELSKEKCKITVITRHQSKSMSVVRKGNLNILRFPTHYRSKRIKRILREKKLPLPNVIHIHSLQYLPLVRTMKKTGKIPVVYTSHSIVKESKGKRSVFTPKNQKSLYKLADAIVVPSQSEAFLLKRKYPLFKNKITVIEHGVKGSNHTTSAPPHLLVYVGRLVEKKGVKQLLNAVPVLVKYNSSMRLFFIGEGPKSYEKKLKQHVKALKIKPYIKWVGKYPYSKLQKSYQKFGAVIMPSTTESFGLVALEALAHGVPLVSTREGGLSLFVNKHVAQVIPKVDSKSIADSIIKMWKNPRLTKKRVIEGKKVANLYRWEEVSKRYYKLFINVTRKR